MSSKIKHAMEVFDLECNLNDLRQAFNEVVAERDALLDEVRRLNAIIKESSK